MKKILIVDDEHDIREILEEFFTLKGYEVKTAENGEAGLEVKRRCGCTLGTGE